MHGTRARARACKAKLDMYGCDPTHFRCDYEHEIVDLRAAWRKP